LNPLDPSHNLKYILQPTFLTEHIALELRQPFSEPIDPLFSFFPKSLSPLFSYGVTIRSSLYIGSFPWSELYRTREEEGSENR
jgi:hypothetical protein